MANQSVDHATEDVDSDLIPWTDQDRTRTSVFKGGASNARVSLPTPARMSTALLHGRSPGLIPATCAAGLSNTRCPSATALLTVGWISGRGAHSATSGTCKALPVTFYR